MAATKHDPKRLAWGAILGATLMASSFFVTLMPFPHVQPALGSWARLWGNRLVLISFLSPVIFGASLWYVSDRRLKQGYASALWSEAELEPVRRLLVLPAWAWISVGLLVLAATALAFSTHSWALIYVNSLPLNAVMGMRRLLNPPLEHTSVLSIWQDSKPIHSEHWGEAPPRP